MDYIKKIDRLADIFAIKYAQDMSVAQNGTTELFFGNESNQRAFNAAAQGGQLAKFITGVAAKTQKTASFDLKASAEPNKGANWALTTVPATIKGAVFKFLDEEFKKIVGKSMTERQVEADKAAKGGAGSGVLEIASLSADMD